MQRTFGNEVREQMEVMNIMAVYIRNAIYDCHKKQEKSIFYLMNNIMGSSQQTTDASSPGSTHTISHPQVSQ